MSVMASLAKAANAKVLTGTRPTTRVFPNAKWTLVVGLSLLALAAFGMIPASETLNAEHSSAARTNSEAG